MLNCTDQSDCSVFTHYHAKTDYVISPHTLINSERVQFLTHMAVFVKNHGKPRAKEWKVEEKGSDGSKSSEDES